MTQVYDKNFQVATCQHCKKQTDISLSKDVRAMVVQNTTLKEMLKLCSQNQRTLHLTKNGEIMAMHKMIFQMFQLLDDKQKENAFKLNKKLREELKYLKKKYLG